MATAGGALPARTGTILYSAQSVQGTPVTPATACGICSFTQVKEEGLTGIHTLGQAAVLSVREGRSLARLTLNITAVQNETLIARALRSSGVVPWTTFGGGYVDDAGTVLAWQMQDAKINTIDVSLDAAGVLSATLEIIGGLITSLTTGMAAAHLTDTVHSGFDGVLTKGGASWESIRFRLNVNNNITPQYVIPGAAPSSFKRGFAYLPEGDQDVSGEITRFAASAVDLQAASMSDFAISLAMTDIGASGNVSTFAVAGAKFGSESWSVSPGGFHEFTTPFIAKTATIS